MSKFLRIAGIVGILGVLMLISIGVLQIYAGYIGIEYHLGTIWAVVFTGLSLGVVGFRFTLPLTVGSFFCALNVWHWHWFAAILFAAPGLIFSIPVILRAIKLRILSRIEAKKDPRNVVIDVDLPE